MGQGLHLALLAEVRKRGRTWATSVGRKAGGVTPDPETMDGTIFVGARVSSVMALVRKVVGHVKRTGDAPEAWITAAFKSLRVTWLLEACGDEIATLSVRENVEQSTRKSIPSSAASSTSKSGWTRWPF